jgi:SAM-dependent methyltransferase
MSSSGEIGAPAVAAEIQDFYERYPYPPPLTNLEAYRQQWQDPLRRRADFHLFWPGRPYRDEYAILVAGCGTSQAAKYAIRWPRAAVTGIDFSATSVRHTEELKGKYRLDNLRVQQLPLDRVTELGADYDLIVCTGVLHHLPDPDAGLAALRSVLKPHGAMHLMVYAPHGRNGIYMLQEFCRRVGIHATDADIRNLIVALRALPPGHPLERLLREAPDFRTEAALADALLHPQDRAYSVPQLFDFLHAGGLRFQRWIRQAPYSPHCGVLSRISQAVRLAALSEREQYTAAELFRGTLMRHSVIAGRDDNPGGSPDISFSGGSWLEYIPIRTPDTLCVQERLPPGSTAVLINRAHTCTDIYLPLNAREKRLFDAIDGKRTIGEMLSAQTEQGTARALFERLWWHDQVVFDASRRAAPLASPPGEADRHG